ncbi:hypothetical protein BAL199_02879 [alpha proteobacterium BAL199]|nr:hypothetical protein BAL199_02879 [alpha proteobacterium BAL199]
MMAVPVVMPMTCMTMSGMPVGVVVSGVLLVVLGHDSPALSPKNLRVSPRWSFQ